MTIIEFYDKVDLENIAGALLCNADKIILIGDNRGKMEKSKQIYEEILRNRGLSTEVTYVSINRNNLQNITNTLESIVLSYEDCVFDLTGGDDLYLVAIGILLNKYEGRVQCHRFNFNNNVIYDCDADGNVCSTLPFVFSVEENVGMYGGTIVRNERMPLHTIEWDWNDEFISDIESMWKICRSDAGYWNVETSILGGICEIIKAEDRLDISCEYNTASNAIYKKHIDMDEFVDFLYRIQHLGLIHSLNTDDKISFVFKNQQIKRCLILPGRVLEMIVTIRLKAVKNSDGEAMYHDVTVGAVIDWDNMDEENPYRTINEIDILAMRGAIPIFISCKNGNFDENELYKLTIIADRFGSKYARKVLIATRLDKLGLKSDYLKTRMADMGIRCIDSITGLDNDEIESLFKSL